MDPRVRRQLAVQQACIAATQCLSVHLKQRTKVRSWSQAMGLMPLGCTCK